MTKPIKAVKTHPNRITCKHCWMKHKYELNDEAKKGYTSAIVPEYSLVSYYMCDLQGSNQENCDTPCSIKNYLECPLPKIEKEE